MSEQKRPVAVIDAWHPSDPVYACAWCGERKGRPGDGDHRRCEVVGRRLTAERDAARNEIKRFKAEVKDLQSAIDTNVAIIRTMQAKRDRALALLRQWRTQVREGATVAQWEAMIAEIDALLEEMP